MQELKCPICGAKEKWLRFGEHAVWFHVAKICEGKPVSSYENMDSEKQTTIKQKVICLRCGAVLDCERAAAGNIIQDSLKPMRNTILFVNTEEKEVSDIYQKNKDTNQKLPKAKFASRR